MPSAASALYQLAPDVGEEVAVVQRQARPASEDEVVGRLYLDPLRQHLGDRGRDGDSAP